MRGLVTQYVLFFIDIASRSVHVAGITPHPDNSWMTQIARNITDADDGFIRGTRYLILDRDSKYSDELGAEAKRSSPIAGRTASHCAITSTNETGKRERARVREIIRAPFTRPISDRPSMLKFASFI
jgi:hypothetical protein